MQIKFEPVYEYEIYHAHSIHFEDKHPGISRWMPGEIKNIPDDLAVRMRVRGEVFYAKLVDTLLQDRAFKIVQDDKSENPNFICSRCAGAATETIVMHPRTGHGIQREIDDEIVCKSCWDKAPKNLTPTGFEFIHTEGK